MDLFEYEGKQLMRESGIPVPTGRMITEETAEPPMDYPFILKAQVMTGGRGKAGGIKVCRSDEEFRINQQNIFAMVIRGFPVHGLLAEEMIRPDRELYLSITLQGVSRPTLIASRRGGMNIEKVSEETPDEIILMEIDPFVRLMDHQIRYLAKRLNLSEMDEFRELLGNLQDLFFDKGALLAEINPLGEKDGHLVAMDSKIVIDDNAAGMTGYLGKIESGRHKLRNYKPHEKEATTITYVSLEGDIGLISDGAGTGMLALDLINDNGGDVASFCEIGGMTSKEVMYRAMQLTFEGRKNIRGVIIVLIGGFNRMDNMALGITEYARDHSISVPVYTRMCGTMEEIGLETMKQAEMPVFSDLDGMIHEFVQKTETKKRGHRYGDTDK